MSKPISIQVEGRGGYQTRYAVQPAAPWYYRREINSSIAD